MRFATSLLLLCLLLSFSSISAQVVKDKTHRAKQRTENKVDRKVDQKIDQAVDQAFDKVSSLFKRKKKTPKRQSRSSETATQTPETPSQKPTSPNSAIFGNTEANTADRYHFDIIVTVHTKTIKKSGKVKDDIEMDWMIANQGDLFGLATYDKKQGKTAIIIDNENKVMLSIMEKEKKAMAFTINDSEQGEDIEDSDSDVTIKKTGRTKNILGYSCDEYTMDSEDMTGTFWLTTQIKMFDLSQMPKRMQKYRKNSWSNTNLNGLMMESTMIEKGKKGKTFETLATKVDKSGRLFKMSNYEVMSLGGFGF